MTDRAERAARAREEAMAPELDDVDPSDLDVDDFTDYPETNEDGAVEPANTEDVLPTPVHHVARMNLNTINLSTGGFAWFSA